VGKAYYEQGKYAEAIEQFQKVIASGKALASDHLNLGLALMQSNRLDEALGELTTAGRMDPKLVAADYNLGILYKRELRYPNAEAALKRVIAADPTEAAAWFNLGTVYFAQKKLEDALEAHKHVIDMGFGKGQNFYVASLFHTFTALVRLKRQDEAKEILKIHETVRDKVPNISLQNPALEGGKYGAIIVPATTAADMSPKFSPAKVVFADVTATLGLPGIAAHTSRARIHSSAVKRDEYSLPFAVDELVPLFGPSLAVGDYNADGHADLYVVNPAGGSRLLQNAPNGTFSDVTERAGVAGTAGNLSATFADYNNSGFASLFVAGVGGVKLYRNREDGTFGEETEKAGLKGKPGELGTQALLFDVDSDGFLDLVATIYCDLSVPPAGETFIFPDDFAGAAVRFYRNNGDGTFSERTEAAGLASATGRMRRALFADFNNDGYLDLVFARDNAPPLLYLNIGEGRFVEATNQAGAGFTEAVALDAQLGDFDHDGNFDLCFWTPTGPRILVNQGGARFELASGLPAMVLFKTPFSFPGLVVDANGDGFLDLLAHEAGTKWRLMANEGGRFQEATVDFPSRNQGPMSAIAPVWLRNTGKTQLVTLTHHGQLAALERQGPPSRWVEVKLNGYKSNLEGTGSIIEIKAGTFYKKVMATGGPVRVPLGELAKLDVVRVTWPNLVIQNSIDVAANQAIEVRESERLASSCPLLYYWDGERYVYLAEILSVAPLGELTPSGDRLKPFPEQFVRLPHNLRPQNGAYVFQLTNELREVDYFDQVRLLAVDHPESEEIYANEIFSSARARPTLYRVQQKRFPISASDDYGNDVLPLIRDADGRYVNSFRRHAIFGMADLHTLTLDLGDLPDGAQVTLWLNGWVLWTDSNGARALMTNSALQMVMPHVQVPDQAGRWVTVVPDMGLPSGTHRTMRVDLTGKFLSADHRVRIVTNLCVYWDQIFFTTEESVVPSPVELPLLSADLHYRGFSTPISTPGYTRPDSFNYAEVMADAPWDPMVGNYTRYGAVEELLMEGDDHLVVMATGDELTVTFDGRALPPLPPGWQRTFFLYASGYAKDGEPNTAYSKTVTPLPFRAMSNYPPAAGDVAPQSEDYQQYLRRYQTRPRYALIPPLAPAVR